MVQRARGYAGAGSGMLISGALEGLNLLES